MGFLGSGYSPYVQSDEEKRKKLLADVLAQNAGPGSSSSQDFQTNFNEPTSSADSVRQKFDAPDVEAPTPTLDRFADWSKRMPAREDYKPSLGRKILGTIVGAVAGYGNPGRAMEFSDSFTNRKYNRAAGEWAAEGKALGDVAPIEERNAASIRSSDLESRRLGQEDVNEQGRNKRETENNAAAAARQQEAQKADLERNTATQKAETERNNARIAEEARAHNLTWKAAEARVAAMNKRTGEISKLRDKSTEVSIPMGEQNKATSSALRDVQIDKPEWANFVAEDDKGNLSIKPFESGGFFSKGDNKDEYDKFVAEIRKRAEAKLAKRRPGTSTNFGMQDVGPVNSPWDDE